MFQFPSTKDEEEGRRRRGGGRRSEKKKREEIRLREQGFKPIFHTYRHIYKGLEG